MRVRLGALLILAATALLGCAVPVHTVLPVPVAADHPLPSIMTDSALFYVPARQVPVLLYHDLAPGATGGNGATIDVAEFERQMAWLATNGYTPVSSAELLAWVEGKGQLPERPVQIHFDDGYLSNYTYALPIMQKHSIRGLLFLVSAFPENPEAPGMVSWAQVQEMAMSGTFEVHGHTHDGHHRSEGVPRLIGWNADQIRSDYRTMVEQMSAAGLPKPSVFAYPFGGHDEETVSALQAEEVRAAFTVQRGYVQPGDDPFRLKRLIVWPGLSECQFAELVTGAAACTTPKTATKKAQTRLRLGLFVAIHHRLL